MTAISRTTDTATRAAAVAAAGLALVQLSQAFASFGSADHIGLLLSFCALAGTAAAVRLWLTDCFECRLFTTLLALFGLAGQFLRAFVGWPGDPVTGWTVYGALVVLLASAVLVLLLAAATRRQRDRKPV